MSDDLQPGDRVIELAAMSRSAGMFSGLIAIPLTVFCLTRSWLWTVLAIIAGLVIGYGVALTMGRLMFPTVDGNVVVVKHGSGSIFAAMRASLAPSIVISVLMVVVTMVLPGPQIWAGSIGIAATLVVGVAIALLGALS